MCGRNYNDHQISNGQDCIPYLFVQCISWDPFLSVLHGNRHSMYAEIYMNLPTLSSIYYPLNLTKCQTKLPTFAGSLKNGVSSLLNSCCFAFHQEETPEAPIHWHVRGLRGRWLNLRQVFKFLEWTGRKPTNSIDFVETHIFERPSQMSWLVNLPSPLK